MNNKLLGTIFTLMLIGLALHYSSFLTGVAATIMVFTMIDKFDDNNDCN